MSFDFRALARFLGGWLTRVPWTSRRLAILLGFVVVYPLLELAVWLGFFVDRLVFPGYRRARIDEPVFIVGNFRSGTTFLHRLLSKDTARFSTMEMWEILFAPSIAQRRLVWGLGVLERALGRPVGRLLDLVERRWHELNVMHKVSLREPEEDDYLLLHVFSALTVGLSSGLLDQARPYAHFDDAMPEGRKRRILSFYRRAVARHLHAHRATGKHYLAKNPALTPKLGALFEEFPDARVIYLARSPLEAVPSFLSMMEFSWRAVGLPMEKEDMREELRRFLLEMIGHWYRAPPDRLEAQSPERSIVVDYHRMVSDPEIVVREIYARFGFEVGEDFAEVLRDESERARGYESRHDYGLEELGLDERELLVEFEDVFERFSFERPGASPPTKR